MSEGDSPLGRRSPTTEVGTGDSTTTTDRTGDSTTTSRAPRPTTTTTRAGPVTTSGASAGEAYPAEVVAAYMGGCMDSEAGEEYCQCTIGEFQRVLTVQEFEAASERFDAGDTPEVFFDVVAACLSEIDTTGTTDPSVTTTTVVAAEPLTIDEVLQIAITDLNAYWTAQLPDLYGVTYAEPRDLVALSGNDEVRCGGLVDREFWLGNAFYCELGDYIAWDSEELIPNLFTSFGDFSVALVLAHEWGHAIQGPERGNVNGRTIMTELQADCFAGAWTGSVDAGESENLSLEQGDVEEAMAGYVQLFRDPPGTSPFDEGAHGTGFDRVAAFRGGFFNGPTRCAEYEQGDFSFLDLPFTEADFQTGGNLPFDDVAPFLSNALEVWWTAEFPLLFGNEWVPVTTSGPFFPSSGDVPTCVGLSTDPRDLFGVALYCAEGDFVAWDGEELTPSLYQEIGDFAVGLVLAHEWATAAQSRAGLKVEGARSELQADCFSGAFSGAMLDPDNPMELFLSAGDLDEGVATFLLFGEVEGFSAFGGTPFQRFDAFQRGFFDGAASCLEAD